MEDVYEALVQASSPLKLPLPWQNISCDPAFFCLPVDKTSLLAELRRQFSDADLLKAGVVIIDADNIVSLHPYLVVDGAPVWAIRTKPNEKPTALIAQMNSFGKNASGKNIWVVSTALQDHRQSELIAAADNQVVLAYSMMDVAILRSIGIAAVPGDKWSRLSKPQLDYLCRWLRISQGPGPNTFDAELRGPLTLALANWSLAVLDRTDIGAATTSWSHFVELHRFLELDFDTFGLWKPSEEHLKQLGYRLVYQNVNKVRAWLLDSMEEDARAIDADLIVKRSPAPTIDDAFRAWQQAERNPTNQFGRQKAYDQYCELVDRQRFDPLVEEALQTSDPLERNAELALAETSRLLQPQVQLLTEKIRRSIGEKGTREGSILTKEELESVLALSDRLIALTEEVQACRRNKLTKTVTSLKPTAVRSKPSASRPKKSSR